MFSTSCEFITRILSGNRPKNISWKGPKLGRRLDEPSVYRFQADQSDVFLQVKWGSRSLRLPISAMGGEISRAPRGELWYAVEFHVTLFKQPLWSKAITRCPWRRAFSAALCSSLKVKIESWSDQTAATAASTPVSWAPARLEVASTTSSSSSLWA